MASKGSQNPDPLKAKRVGHPERQKQFLGVDVLEWYHAIVRVRQQKKRQRLGHPPKGKKN
jgi:hypothetical protein